MERNASPSFPIVASESVRQEEQNQRALLVDSIARLKHAPDVAASDQELTQLLALL
jgi:hypothetical protein